jgi:hypothetical protein
VAVDCATELLIGVPTTVVSMPGTSDREESFQVCRIGKVDGVLRAGLSRSGTGG